MEVVIPLQQQQHQNMDFDFTSAFTTPYSTAPSTPKRFGHFSYVNSAPASPNHTSEFYNFHYELHDDDEIQSEEDEFEFAFVFSAESEKTSLPADELFDDGKIKSLLVNTSPNSPKSSSPKKSPISQGKKMFQYAFSSKQKNKQTDDSQSTLENTIKEETHHERFQMTLNPNSNHRSARSLAPCEVSQQKQQQTQNTNMTQSTTNTNSKPESTSTAIVKLTSSSSASSSSKSKLRSLRDLFRSASEGHISDKDPIKKYSSLYINNKKHEDVKNSSFRLSADSGSVSKRRAGAGAGQVSAHEMHYNMKRAAAEQSKKKTFLPYKQGFFMGTKTWFM